MATRIKDIRLNETQLFGRSQKVGLKYLLRMDPDRLLAPLYEGSEKTPKKERYGGWESLEIKGHSVGHYLSALAIMYAATGDKRLKKRLDYMVDEMAQIQREDGYLAGFSSAPFDQAFTGDFEVDLFSLNRYWVPWYSIHKVYEGLVEAYRVGENHKALEVVKRMADWLYTNSRNMSDAAFQRMLISEHGGMNETMAHLYEITKDDRYLYLAKRFTHDLIIGPLMEGVDELEGKHANTQIPKVLGAAQLYDMTGDMRYRTAATNFFDQVVEDRSFVIGGNSNGEHFGPSNHEVLAKDTAETCNTYNMMRLAIYLFKWTKDVKYMDYYERALYNHILASQDPITGAKTYFVSTYPGHFKVYGTDENAFWCCTGTGMENPGRYNIGIYKMFQDGLYINLFIASTLTIADRGIILEQDTAFPNEEVVYLRFKEAKGEKLSLHIRMPYWLQGEASVTVGGVEYRCSRNGYLEVEGMWKKGDVLEVRLPMGLHQYTAKDDPNKIAVLYGPLVLAGALGKEHFPDNDIVDNQVSLMNWPNIEVPVILAEDPDLSKWLLPVKGKERCFETEAIGHSSLEKVQLKPFYALHHERYTLYWQKLTPAAYEASLKEKKIEARVIDTVEPGRQQSEIEHNFKLQNATLGYSEIAQSNWREARGVCSLISYDLEVKDAKVLEVTYYADDEILGRHFKVAMNEVVLHEEWLPEGITTRRYTLPVHDLEKACISFTSHFIIGKILSIRTLA